MKYKPVIAAALASALLGAAQTASAVSITPDQIIYQSGASVPNPSQLSGTIDMTVSGTTMTILLKNTSPDSAASSAQSLLTGIGFQLPGAVTILGGQVFVGPSSVGVNFGAEFPNTAAGSDISAAYNYGNSAFDGFGGIAGVLSVNRAISSVNNGQATPFSLTPATVINGPDYGAVSSLEAGLGNGTAAVKDTVRIVLNLSGATTTSAIDAGNVILAFGSPTALVGGGGAFRIRAAPSCCLAPP